jgi:hypothetical protein
VAVAVLGESLLPLFKKTNNPTFQSTTTGSSNDEADDVGESFHISLPQPKFSLQFRSAPILVIFF